jgi:hypothetical protein
MIRHLTYESIDKTQWDLCIEQSLNSMIYGYSWYLDSVAPKWEGLVLNDYEAVMPLVWNEKLFTRYLYQPFFTQQLGLFYKTPAAHDRLIDFIKAIPASYKFIDINLNENNDLLHTDFELRKRKNYVLELEKPYARLQKGYDDHCKRNLKKAKKYTHTIRPVETEVAVRFYRKYKGEATTVIGPQDYKRLKTLLEKAEQKGMLLVRGVYNDVDELLATGIFLISKGRIIYLIGSASSKGREARAMYTLFDNIILQFSEQPIILDFEGSEIPGIARFFKGFGPEKRSYFKLHINRLPAIIRWLK